MVSKFKKCMKKLDIVDMWLFKLSTASFVLFLIVAWPVAMAWVHSVH